MSFSGFIIRVGVGMVVLGDFVECFFNFFGFCVFGDIEDFVVIFFSLVFGIYLIFFFLVIVGFVVMVVLL